MCRRRGRGELVVQLVKFETAGAPRSTKSKPKKEWAIMVTVLIQQLTPVVLRQYVDTLSSKTGSAFKVTYVI